MNRTLPARPPGRRCPARTALLLRAAWGGTAGLVAACAHVEAPPGGPVPESPLAVVAVRPDTPAIVPGWRGPAVIAFDRPLSERGVQEAVSLSPAPDGFTVDHRGSEIRVQPRRGWAPGTIYHVEVVPGVQDRFNNRLEAPVRLVFSTGPEIPDTRVSGRLTDRVRGEPAVGARLDAVRLPDSLTYTTLTDSAGRFEITRLPEGEYLLLGYRDANRNRRVDAFEPRDSARVDVAVGSPAQAELALLLPDTTAPAVGSARMAGLWVEVRFDDHLDPDQPLSPEQVTIAGPDGAAVPIARLRIGGPSPADTTPAAVADTLADTVPVPRALPSQSLFVEPAVELVPDGHYTVTVRGVRNLHGLVGGGEAPLRVPAAAPAPAPEPAPSPGAPPPVDRPPDPPPDADPEPEPGPGDEPPPDEERPPGGPSAGEPRPQGGLPGAPRRAVARGPRTP
jgi:hypothetical protein